MTRWSQPQGIHIRKCDGRAVIWCRDQTAVYYYRAVVEASIGRHLTAEEVVHHINGDRTDDRIENLSLTTQSEHARAHGHSWRSSRWPDRRCAGCGCDHDETTEGCRHCGNRHHKRAQAAA